MLEAGSGLVLGKAFVVLPSAKARGWLQWCFASQDIDCLVQGVGRLERWLGLYSKALRNAALSRLTCRNTIQAVIRWLHFEAHCFHRKRTPVQERIS